MIKNLWYGILDAKEVKPGKPVGVTRCNEKLVLWRTPEGKISCIADQCCHRGASLCQGKLHADGIACPFHGFVHDSSGKVVRIPANGKNTPVPVDIKLSRLPSRKNTDISGYGMVIPRVKNPKFLSFRS